MISDDYFISILDRIRWYTRPPSARERLLAVAREIEQAAAEAQLIADELQSCADEIRRNA